ncbi:Putative pumilio homolog 8, chloroplastic [Linum grandiflorum]
MFPWPNGFYPDNGGDHQQPSFSPAANTPRQPDQSYSLHPPPPHPSLATDFTLGDHPQFPYHHPQESLESLFYSLSLSDRRRGFDGFVGNKAAAEGSGGFLPAPGNPSSIGWIPNYDDQLRHRIFNQGSRAHNYQGNAAASAGGGGGGFVMLPSDSRDYYLRRLLALRSETDPRLWDGNFSYKDRISSPQWDSQSRSANPRRSSNFANNRRSSNHQHHNPSSTSSNLNVSRRSDSIYETANSLDAFKGQILSMAQDQHGCRTLQRIIGTKKTEEIERAFVELKDHVGQLMLDQFGNYVVQRLLDVCSDKQRTEILMILTANETQLLRICLNPHGTRAIQKLLDHVTTSHQISIIMPTLSRAAVSLTKDMNGHHVIQHCLKSFSHNDNKYLLNKVADNCFEIATDKSGCCVLQVCVEYSRGETRDRLVSEIIGNALHLSQDCYGNYVVQNIVGLKVEKINAALLAQLQGDLVNLSCNKYGSNVVEKCLTETTEEQSTQVMMELLSSPKSSLMLVDPFGNFVIQTALLISQSGRNPMVRSALVDLVERNAPMMRSNIYGKKVLHSYEKRQWIRM